MRGVSLSSNGLSLPGRCGDREDLGTSDPQGTPKKTCELQCQLPPSEQSGADAFIVGG